jgi:hypothetical protein
MICLPDCNPCKLLFISKYSFRILGSYFFAFILMGFRTITSDPSAKKTECGSTPSINVAKAGPYSFLISASSMTFFTG